MNNRIKWIDVAKGILIILVVLGHSQVNFVVDFVINSFHMCAFFVLSGWTICCSNSFASFVKKKLKSLIIPYLIFSGIMLLYQLLKTVLFDGYIFELKSGILSVLLPVSGRTSTTVYGLWFLPCLFLAELLFFGLQKLKQRSTALSLGMFAAITLFCLWFYKISSVVSIINILPIALLFIIIGAEIKIHMSWLETRNKIVAVIALFIFIVTAGLNYLFFRNAVDLSSMTLGILPLYIVSGIFGSIFTCCVAMMMKNSVVFTFLGRNSLYYYGLHYEVLGLVGKFAGGVLQTVITLIVLFPVIFTYEKYRERLRLNR